MVYTTHCPELVSFEEKQVITRLVRTKGKMISRSVDDIDAPAKLQSKLDDRGAHDFLFSTGAVLCEGPNDTCGLRCGFEKKEFDIDGRSISTTLCGSTTPMPSFAYIASELGIRWCALTDQDLRPDGTNDPQTEKQRGLIEGYRGEGGLQVQWPVNLKACLNVVSGKAKPEDILAKLNAETREDDHPDLEIIILTEIGILNDRAA